MTNEEAIKELMMAFKDLKHMCYMDCGREAAFNKACEVLRAELCEDTISRKHLLSEIDALMQSPWFNNGKDDDTFTHYAYVERKEAVEVVRDLCVKAEPPVSPKPRLCKYCKYYERDHFSKIEINNMPLITAHEICMKWGGGCKTREDGYCHMFEPKEGESD